MRLQNVDVFYWVLGLSLGVGHLHILHGIDNHVCEKVSLTVE
jgi:hypothetical protein